MEVTNRFTGLDLIDRMSEKTVDGVCDIVQDSDQGHPQEKEIQIGKILSEEALQTVEKRREAKRKGEKKKRYTHLNAQFQRIAKREKKVFPSDACKDIEENNINGKD